MVVLFVRGRVVSFPLRRGSLIRQSCPSESALDMEIVVVGLTFVNRGVVFHYRRLDYGRVFSGGD